MSIKIEYKMEAFYSLSHPARSVKGVANNLYTIYERETKKNGVIWNRLCGITMSPEAYRWLSGDKKVDIYTDYSMDEMGFLTADTKGISH